MIWVVTPLAELTRPPPFADAHPFPLPTDDERAIGRYNALAAVVAYRDRIGATTEEAVRRMRAVGAIG